MAKRGKSVPLRSRDTNKNEILLHILAIRLPKIGCVGYDKKQKVLLLGV